MKKQLIFSLLLLPFVVLEAKILHKMSSPDYVGINEGKMKIVSVKTTEESTIITFQCSGEESGTFSPKIYLEDELGICYGLTGQKGFSVDSLKRLVPNKKGKYELHFKPLPANTRIFDLIENFNSISSTRFYGIRETGTPFATSNPQTGNEGKNSLPDIDFKVDSVLVTGHIEDYDSLKNKFKIVSKFNVDFIGEEKSSETAKIDKNGNFRIKIRVLGPTWSYLTLGPENGWNGVTFIPVVLYPNDHINLNINFDNEVNKIKVAYNSLLQKDFSRLMQCAPIFYTNPNVTHHSSMDSSEYKMLTAESIEKRFSDYDALAIYLKGKYCLNNLEAEMLRSQLSVVTAIDIIGKTNRFLFDTHSEKWSVSDTEGKKKAHENWRKSDSPYYELCFSKVRAESNAFLVTPDWSVLLSAHSMDQIPRHEKHMRDFWINKHSAIYKKEIEITETGQILIPKDRFTPEMEKIKKEFEQQQITLYHNWELELIRDWRKKNKNDAIFEQAFMLCSLRDMPIALNLVVSETELYDRFHKISQCRGLFYHPSVIRIAGKLLGERELEIYAELESLVKEEN